MREGRTNQGTCLGVEGGRIGDVCHVIQLSAVQGGGGKVD